MRSPLETVGEAQSRTAGRPRQKEPAVQAGRCVCGFFFFFEREGEKMSVIN